MSETSALLSDATERVFAQHLDDVAMRAARGGAWPAALWEEVAAQGLPLALVEGEQGFGIPLSEGLALLRTGGGHAVPLPLAETMVANLLLARAGLPVTSEPVALVAGGVTIQGRSANGRAERVAWGRDARALLIEGEGGIGLMTDGFDVVATGENLARQPRDMLALDGTIEVAPHPGPAMIEVAALARALAMAGALDRLVALTVAHVSERVQFGRPLSAFQAVQHSLARLAGEAAAAGAAADLAAEAFASDSPRFGVAVAAARARIGEAAGVATGLAHQLHGAIGVTEEHRLHWLTTALMSWRDEFGTQAWWTRRLGAAALAETPASFWPFVTSV